MCLYKTESKMHVGQCPAYYSNNALCTILCTALNHSTRYFIALLHCLLLWRVTLILDLLDTALKNR